MLEIVTVEQAIKRGKRTITTPAILILVSFPLISYVLLEMGIISSLIAFLSFIFSAILSIIYWSLTISKWRIWAFENVRNVHLLKKRAIQENLIHEDDSIFTKLEIRSKSQAEEWNSILKKFEKEDVFTDDLSIPNETIISFPTNGRSISMYATLGSMLVVCIILLIQLNIYGVAGSVLFLVFAYLLYKKLIVNEWQITINKNGIQTRNTVFYKWRETTNEMVLKEGSSKHPVYYLQFEHPSGIEKLEIDISEIDNIELERLMRIYRGRSENSTT